MLMQETMAACDAEDANRWRWLRGRLLAADFDWQESGECVLIFRFPKNTPVSADASTTVDGGIAAEHVGDGEALSSS